MIRKNLPAKVVRHEVLNALLAGRETTAALLSNLFFLLSRRPDIEERLRAEIANLQDLSIDATTRLPYLKAFINESMRLYPIVPQQARQAVQDTTLPLGGGVDEKSPVFIAKGSLCGWNLYAMHRRKDLFGEDAEELKPERWLDTHNGKGIQPGWAYLPFSGGPRVCIGRKSCYPFWARAVQKILMLGIQSNSPLALHPIFLSASYRSFPWLRTIQGSIGRRISILLAASFQDAKYH